ncbi:hypothetical protein LZD49_33925 [Dyadobacter sp. CY261]|nr:hypothetical protein [Dyadobacter sp. CY261]
MIRSPLFSGLHKTQNYKLILNIYWGILGFSALYVAIILFRDYNKDQKEIALDKNKTQLEIEKVRASLEKVRDNPQIVKSDPALKELFDDASKSVLSQNVKMSDSHSDEAIDHSRCWIKTNFASQLVKTPTSLNPKVISTEIPEKIYYVIDKQEIGHFHTLFFKIKLENGLEGWVRDFQLDKNPKCYD